MSSSSRNSANSASEPAPAWNVQASWGALNTSNPIREIIETMNLAENPDKKVIPLSIGDPTIFGNLKPCKEILDALQKANSCEKHFGYQTAAGLEAARDAVADYHYRCTGNKVKRQDVILASGCSHALDLSICVLARHGQNILIPRPGFPLYKTLTSVYGIQYKQYNLLAEKNWSIDLNHLESLIDENTAAIVVNNPSNPCGSVFSRNHLLQILELAERYKKPIIADEIYDKFVFSPELYRRYRAALTEAQNCIGSRAFQLAANGRTQVKVPSSNGTTDCMCDSENLEPISAKSGGGSIDANDPHHNYADEISGSFQSFNTNNGYDVDDHDDYVDISEDGTMEISTTIDISDDIDEDDHDDDELAYVPFRALSSLSKRVPILTCGGISKTCLIPGLRLGWIIINDRQNIFEASVRNGLNRLTQRLMGPNSLVQGALNDILTKVPETFYSQTMDFIFKNAKLCYERLSLVRGLQPHMPQGSMYLMVRFEAKAFPKIDGDLDFTSKLMNEESVLVLPGRCFDFPNYFRICLTVPTNVMEEALDRMRGFCERHYCLDDNSLSGGNRFVSLVQTNYSTASTQLTVEELATPTQTQMLKINLSSSNSINTGHKASKCK